MRSRYSAFAKALPRYIVDTLLPEKREIDELDAVKDTIERCEWFNLDVMATEGGLEGDDTGMVEYVATYVQKDYPGVQHIHERSRFSKVDGVWFYVDGDMLPVPSGADKPGRNDPCWCGSGLKFKKCHGRNF